MKNFLLSSICASLAASALASELASDVLAPITCGTNGALTNPSCTRSGSHIAPDDAACRTNCMLSRRCASYSYDAPSKKCRLYTQSLLAQGFVALEESSTRYWQRDCSSRHRGTPAGSSPTRTSSSSSLVPASGTPTPTANTCTEGDTRANGFANPEFYDGLFDWTATTNGCDPNSVSVTGQRSAALYIPRGRVVTSSLSQNLTGCNGYTELLTFQYELIEGGPGCTFTAAAPPLGRVKTVDFTGDDASGQQVFGLGSQWGPGPGSTANSFPVTFTLACDGTQAATNVTLSTFFFNTPFA